MARTTSCAVAVTEGVARAFGTEEIVWRRSMNAPSLTPREQDVLLFLTVGKSNREIAAELNISLSTVKSHLSSIYGKLGVSNRTEAALSGLKLFPMLGVQAS